MAPPSIVGAAWWEAREGVLTWGRDVMLWPGDGGAPKTLLRDVNFGPGGCVAGDDFFVQEKPGPSRLLHLETGSWRRDVVEQETEFSDCLPYTLYGKRGVLMIHFFAQVRFYVAPKWDYRELYSIYTASRQGGLLPHDVDGDGQVDFFVGNYWMRNPGSYDLPWRLFAVNVHHETPGAANARLALLPGGSYVWAESEAAPARVSVFSPPEDFRQLWKERRLEGVFEEPKGVAVLDGDIVIGDRTKVVRVGDRSETLASGFRTLGLWVYRGRILAATPEGVRVIQPRK